MNNMLHMRFEINKFLAALTAAQNLHVLLVQQKKLLPTIHHSLYHLWMNQNVTEDQKS